MKPRFFFLTVSLIAVQLAVSCAPAAPTEAEQPAPEAPPATVIPATEAPTNPAAPEATQAVATEIPVQAVATSRGPNLEATDPTTVSLASGGLQLVEFFRFT